MVRPLLCDGAAREAREVVQRAKLVDAHPALRVVCAPLFHEQGGRHETAIELPALLHATDERALIVVRLRGGGGDAGNTHKTAQHSEHSDKNLYHPLARSATS
eukprot:6554524-Prymnesium_polylepis.1